MKKIISIIAILTILLSLVACDTENNKNNTENNKNDLSSILEKITEKPTYEVTFETNGGTPINPMKTDNIENEPMTAKDSHIFDGWYLDYKFIEKASFPLTITEETTLFAKWVRSEERIVFKDEICLKNWDGTPYASRANVTPEEIDLDWLEANDYKITIKLEYTVRYKKDYDVPFDIGYMGAPKYSVYVSGVDKNNNSKTFMANTDVKATTSSKIKTEIITYEISEIKDRLENEIKITFSTENIQNKVYFSDIAVTYECHK